MEVWPGTDGQQLARVSRHSREAGSGSCRQVVFGSSATETKANAINVSLLRLRRLSLFDLDLRELCDQLRGPAIHICFSDGAAHSLHPAGPLFSVHLQCVAHGLSHLLNVVRIDDQSGLEFTGRTRETTED